jgi:hypothetical protein
LISTSVRPAPNPRSDSVFAPGPPSVTKPPNALLTCAAPVVTAVPCNASVVELNPAAKTSSRVITCTGDGELNVSRRIREPVTTTTSCPSWLGSCPETGVAAANRPQPMVAVTAPDPYSTERIAREMAL